MHPKKKAKMTNSSQMNRLVISLLSNGTFGPIPFPGFFVPDLPYLLIGRSLPATLAQQESCQTQLETGLVGLTLQPIGTLRSFKYKDSTGVNVGVGHSGLQASWSTQIKTNPGIMAKESILLRWKLEPRFRNPRLLLLWYGVEVSFCTNNARRCRIIDLLRSHAIIQYLSTIYRPDIVSNSSDYKRALFDALRGSDPNMFIELYDSHPEWQAELGIVVARCLDILNESGVNRNGDLAAFTFIESFHDPEHLAILSKKLHTWVGLLKDSADTATFALISHQCLGYPLKPGRMCRHENWFAANSVLETSYTATRRSNLIKHFTNIKLHDRLRMQNRCKFKVKQRSSRGILVGIWERGPLGYLNLPGSTYAKYREKRQDGEQAIRVFVVSKRDYRPVRARQHPLAPSMTNESGTALDHIDPNLDYTANLQSTIEKSRPRPTRAHHSTTESHSLHGSSYSQTSPGLPPYVLSPPKSNIIFTDKSTQTACHKATQTENPSTDSLPFTPTSLLPGGELLSTPPTNGETKKSSSSRDRRRVHRHHRKSSSSSRHGHSDRSKINKTDYDPGKSFFEDFFRK